MSFKKFKTEKMLLVSIGVLTLFLFASAFSKELGTNVSMAEEDSGSSSASELSSEDSGDSEDSTSEDSGNSEDSASEDSGLSVSSAPSVKRMQAAGSTEISEKSTSEASQQSVEESSEASEASELSEESQESEESIKYVEGYGDVVSKEGNVALVKKDGKLFFLIPVEIESQVTLDEQGSVVGEEKSFLNWLLSVFSF